MEVSIFVLALRCRSVSALPACNILVKSLYEKLEQALSLFDIALGFIVDIGVWLVAFQ
jgi:hypothetical protein